MNEKKKQTIKFRQNVFRLNEKTFLKHKRKLRNKNIRDIVCNKLSDSFCFSFLLKSIALKILFYFFMRKTFDTFIDAIHEGREMK